MKINKVAIWGIGHIGRLCSDKLSQLGYEVVCYIDKTPPSSGFFNGIPVYSSDRIINHPLVELSEVELIVLAFLSCKSVTKSILKASGYKYKVVEVSCEEHINNIFQERVNSKLETCNLECVNRINRHPLKSINTHLLSNNRKLSGSEISTARKIADECVEMVLDRDKTVKNNICDAEFSLPSANWSYDAANEYISLFRRVAKVSPDDLNCFRGFTQVFSGYNLYEVCDGRGLSSSGLVVSDELEGNIKINLIERNRIFVDEWMRMTQDVGSPFLFCPPPILGEVGHTLNGFIINNDTCTYQERVNLMIECGLTEWMQSLISKKGEIRILEIGGGYGALAYWIKSAFPNATYTLIDLPESLLFSRLYLSLARPDIKMSVGVVPNKYGILFVPNFLSDRLDITYDLVINTLSMSEMSSYQVNRYVDLIKNKWIADGGIFFEQNQNNTHMGLLFAQEIFKDHFFYRQKISENKLLRNGYANLWSVDAPEKLGLRKFN